MYISGLWRFAAVAREVSEFVAGQSDIFLFVLRCAILAELFLLLIMCCIALYVWID